MAKPYTWKEIESFLRLKLKSSKCILTFGTIGSLNIDNDIDVIITKKTYSKSSDFYKEIHTLFNSLDSYLNKKYSAKVIRFSTATEQFSLSYVAKKGQNDLLFHTMIYFSYPQMKNDWSAALLEKDDLKDILINNYNILLGNINLIFEKDFLKRRYYDSIYNFIYLYDKINSHFPNKLLISSMNHFFDYLFRKRLNLKAPIAKNKKDVLKYFYELCDILDDLEKNI